MDSKKHSILMMVALFVVGSSYFSTVNAAKEMAFCNKKDLIVGYVVGSIKIIEKLEFLIEKEHSDLDARSPDSPVFIKRIAKMKTRLDQAESRMLKIREYNKSRAYPYVSSIKSLLTENFPEWESCSLTEIPNNLIGLKEIAEQNKYENIQNMIRLNSDQNDLSKKGEALLPIAKKMYGTLFSIMKDITP